MQRGTPKPAVDRLPAAVLGHVLVIFADDAFENWTRTRHGLEIVPDSLLVSWPGMNPYSCFDVTLVCRRWRKVALACSAFWSNVIVGPRRNVELLLNRSKDHPLHIFCLVSDILGRNPRHAALSIALAHLRRVRSLQLIVRPQDEGKEPLILFQPSSAPLLVSLSVHFAEASGHARAPQRSTSIREIGAKWDAPRLRHLKYYGGTDYALPLDSFPPVQSKSTLTHLIWLPGGPTHSKSLLSSAEDLLSALRSLPQLVTLHVAVSKDKCSEPTTPSSPVRLPHLRRLLLDGHIDTCVQLLDRLDFKEPLLQFAVMARQESQRRDDVVPLTEYLADLFEAQAGLAVADRDRQLELQTLCIRPDTTMDGKGTLIMGWQTLQAPTRFPMDMFMLASLSRPAYEDLALCLSLPDALPRAHLDRFFKHMRFDGVRALQLGGVEHYEYTTLQLSPAWARPAGRLAAVESLAFAVRADPALLARHLVRVSEGSRAALYPALRHLHITGLCVEGQDVDESGRFKPKGTWATFVDTVAGLVDDGVRLEKLTLSDTIVPLGKADLMGLRQLVPSVLSSTVDGMQRIRLGKAYLVPEYVNDRWEIVEDELKRRP